jgi:hypothetical protein
VVAVEEVDEVAVMWPMEEEAVARVAVARRKVDGRR